MGIKVVCEECSADFRAKDEHAGRRVKCPECGAPLVIPDGNTRRRSSGRTRRGSQAGGLPAWAWGVIGGGGALIVVLVAMLTMSGGSPDPSTSTATTDLPPVNAASGASSASPAMPAAVPDSTAGTAPAGGVIPVAQTTYTAPQGTTPITASTPPGSPVSPTGSGGNALAATSDSGAPGGLPLSNSSAASPSGNTIGANGVTGTSSAISRDQPYANLADLIEAVEKAVVRINVETSEGTGNGSGFVVDTEGTIITNVHVIEGASRVTALFEGDKTEYPITDWYHLDVKRDIAIVKINCPKEKLNPLKLAPDIPRKGEELVAFGAPLGLDFTATQGILSAVRESEDLVALGILDQEGTWLQHTVPISPGNSGGPLVNMKGEVVAMNTMTMTIGQNLNFAISAGDIRTALEKKGSPQPLRQGSVPQRPGGGRSMPKPPQDIVGTDQAKEFLRRIKSMAVIMLRLGFDPTRRVTAAVRSDLEDSLDKAKIRSASFEGSSEAFMMVGMELSEGTGTAGTQQVTITAVCFFRDTDGSVYKIWDEREKVGTVAGRLFYTGEIPKNLRSGIKSYFSKFSAAVNRSRLEAERAKKSQ